MCYLSDAYLGPDPWRRKLVATICLRQTLDDGEICCSEQQRENLTERGGESKRQREGGGTCVKTMLQKSLKDLFGELELAERAGTR